MLHRRANIQQDIFSERIDGENASNLNDFIESAIKSMEEVKGLYNSIINSDDELSSYFEKNKKIIGLKILEDLKHLLNKIRLAVSPNIARKLYFYDHAGIE